MTAESMPEVAGFAPAWAAAWVARASCPCSILITGKMPVPVRPTAHIISRVQVPAGATASSPVFNPYCVAARRGGEQGKENRWPVGVRT